MNTKNLHEMWSFEFTTSCHRMRSQCRVCRKSLMLETFGRIKRRQTAVFSVIWMGCGELQKPRWDMINA